MPTRATSSHGSRVTRPPPDAASLREAALNYLARYATTEAALRRILAKRIDRWAQTQANRDAAEPVAAAARDAIKGVVAALVQAGALSDGSFAEGRARSLARSGCSHRAIQARLMAKGVAPELARRATGDDVGAELAAALILARRRRIGPFHAAEPEGLAAARRKALGMFARAGFARDTAERALEMDAAEAERLIRALRSDEAVAD